LEEEAKKIIVQRDLKDAEADALRLQRRQEVARGGDTATSMAAG
jgi:hypothetical protein